MVVLTTVILVMVAGMVTVMTVMTSGSDDVQG
jgi:hypothetical protein